MIPGVPCVGFADCPCGRCRATRVAVTDAHPAHAGPDASYCGVCRTLALAQYAAPHGVTR